MVTNVNSKNFLFLLFSLVTAAIMTAGGFNSYKILEKKTIAQNNATDSVNEWKQSYKGLQNVTNDWKNKFEKTTNVPDVRALIAVINLKGNELFADTDNVNVVSVEQISLGGIDIGLSKICLGVNSDTFILKAKTYNELLNGLDRLAGRSDLLLGRISIQGDLALPQAKFSNFCVFLRNE